MVLRTVAATFLLTAGAAGAAPRSGVELERAIDAYVAPLRAIDVFSGVVLVARGDRVIARTTYGDANVELGVPNSPDRVFRIASLTKVFTEVLLGRLEEQGTLRLSDPLSRWLPGFPKADSITLDQLRNHRAGVPSINSIPYDEEAHGPNTLDSLVRAIAKEPLEFPPGSRRRYSNGGYAVLAAVIEKATGRSYAEALEREVLRPLRLAHTRHESDNLLVPNRAYGYRPGPLERHQMMTAPFQEMVTKTGGGSLVSTAGDLHRLLRAMYRDNVIRAATWWKLFPRDDSLFSYQGRCPGYNVVMSRDFEHDYDVVVLCNNYAAGMVADVARDAIRLARGEQPPAPGWRGDLPADSAACRPYLGTWRADDAPLPYGTGPFDISWRSGGMRFSVGDAPVDYMLPQGDGAFLLRNLWSEVRFEPAVGGAAPQVTIRPLWFETKAVAMTRSK
jgi:CubicO group peptidase (beta-lactamase class C family)